MQPLGEPGREVLGRQRAAEQVALHLVAAHRAQRLELRRRLHTLGHGGHAQAVRHDDHRLRDGLVFAAVGQGADERAVDLQRMHVETLQVRQRGMPGAEVVERGAHANAREVGEHGARGLVVLHQHRLGELDVQPLGRDAVFEQRIFHMLGQVGVAELARREIDGHAQQRQARSIPGGELRAGGADDPGTDGQHKAGLFEHGDEAVGRHHAATGRVPAQQRLDAGDDAIGQARLGLIVQQEFLALDSAAQRPFERQARGHRRVQVFAEEAEDAAPERLGAVHRHIGMAHEAIEVGLVCRVHRDADAGRDDHLFLAHLERRVERIEQALRDQRCIVAAAQTLGDDGELVTTQARDGDALALVAGAAAAARKRVGRAQAAGERLGHMLQEAVAGFVAEAVVDDLEAVEVEKHQRQLPPAAARALHRAFEPAAKERTIGQAGEAVEVGQLHEAVLRLAAVAQVAQAHQPVGAARLRPAGQRLEVQLDRRVAAIFAAHAGFAVAQRRIAIGRGSLLDMIAAGAAGEQMGRQLHQAAGGRVGGQDQAALIAQQQRIDAALEERVQPALGHGQALLGLGQARARGRAAVMTEHMHQARAQAA